VLICVICVLCLIVVPLLPGRNPFAIKINNKKICPTLAFRESRSYRGEPTAPKSVS
jgi:hypothetical protein